MVNQTAADMISSNQPRPPNQCKSGTANTTSSEPTVSGSLVWSKSMQGLVLSAFYWGYMFSQVLGGYLAGRFGGKWIILGSVGTSTVLTLVSPICAIAHVGVFLAVRVIMGFSQGMMFPAFHSLWAQWAPPLERSLLTGITYAGNQIGMTIVMPISGVLCQYGFAHGWPSVYYVFGIAGIVWCAIWLLYGSDTPSVHRFISQEEKEFLEDELHETRHISDEKKPPIPWKAILKSKAVWGLWAGHFAADWGAYTMAAGLPLFLNDVLGLQLTEMGFLSAIPYLAYFVVINVSTFAADAIRNAAWMTTLNVRRAAMIIALGSQAVFLVACGFCGCGQQALVIVFLTLGIGLSGASYAGFVVNYLDIAPTFAGPLLGTGQTVSCIAGILCPIIIGWLTPQV
ncbi:unnamed protein product [Anisakis simplex]|uniref:Uncharacterized transporter (inferred by orthology to a C. elegans protein) n=1 Tax=Anisakis simplex TaxID=6269 RepID=A0A0M3KCD6_ANISI|nr:unnamed protein product [Anisakis simplex]